MPRGVYERKYPLKMRVGKYEQALMFGIVNYFIEHQRFPTIRQCVAMGLYKSNCGVHRTLKRLEKRGLLASHTVGKLLLG